MYPSLAPSSSEYKHFFFKYKQMSFEKEPRKKVIITVNFMEKRKIDFLLICVKIHVICVKKQLNTPLIRVTNLMIWNFGEN